MTTRIVPFDPVYCKGARVHPSQARYQQLLDDPSFFRVLWPETYSAIDGDELAGIGGHTLIDGVSGGWALFTNKITPARFLVIHRTVVRALICFEGINDPIFAHVDPNNPQAVRWAGLLGLDTRRTDVLPDGRRMLRVETHVH